MSKKKSKRAYINHPRYGGAPIQSEYKFLKEDIDHAHWHYTQVKYFPKTAIPADIEKQNYSTFPREIYVDIEVLCDVCNHPFLFFALEQKYWFETLGFYIDAHCTRCTNCRAKDREIKNMKKTYQNLVNKQNRTSEENKMLKQASLELYMRGYIKNKSKI